VVKSLTWASSGGRLTAHGNQWRRPLREGVDRAAPRR
jgi:hypothetical protein